MKLRVKNHKVPVEAFDMGSSKKRGDPVTTEYKSKFDFSGGRIIKVVYDVASDLYVNVERAKAAAMARD